MIMKLGKICLHQAKNTVETSKETEKFQPINIFTDEAFTNNEVPKDLQI